METGLAIDLSKDLDIKFVPCDVKIETLEDTLIENYSIITFKTRYYWDSHGKLIPWESNGKKSRTFYNVKVELRHAIKRCGDYEYEEEYLCVDGKHVSFDSYSIAYDDGIPVEIKCKEVIGWG